MFYLYVKTHNVTGLKYLGYTKQDPFKYKGSGKYWKRHLQKHGPDVSTEIVYASEVYDDIVQEGIFLSEQHQIVSSKNWANLKNEMGDGGWDLVNSSKKLIEKRTRTYNNASPETKAERTRKRLDAMALKSPEEIAKINASKANHGKDNYWYGKDRSGELNPMFGREQSEETKRKISEANKGRKRTPEVRQKISEFQNTYWTEEKKAEHSKKSKERGIRPPSPLGLKWFNNGVINKRAREHPGEDFKPGRLFAPRKRKSKNGA